MKSALTVVITLTATAGILFSGCSLVQRAMPGSTMSNGEILGLLNTINRSEIDAGELAKQKASTQEVRSFASRMVSEHQMMVQNTKELAQRLNVQPENPALASTLGETHQETMEELQAKSGSDFDEAYIAYQVKMHEQAVDLVNDAADSVDSPNLKLHLREARPDLQNHLAAAQSIEQQ
jgi:putative membrane protein